MAWRKETHEELLKQAYQGSRLSSLFSVAAGVLLCMLVWQQAPLFLILPWICIFLISQAIRLGMGFYYESRKNQYPYKYWFNILCISVYPSSILWGLFPFASFFYVDEVTRIIITIAIASSPIVQLLALGGVFRVWVISMFFLLTPICLMWFFFYGTAGTTLGVIGLLYIVYLYAIGKKFYVLMADKVELHFKADKASHAKTTFLATASHDLRQPLHAITMSIAAAQARLENDHVSQDDITGALKSINTIDHSIQSLSSLLDALFDVSKLESGGVKPKITTIPVSNLFEFLDKTYKPRAIEKGLNFRIVPSNLKINSDPIYLQRIIGNLVSNAVRHISEGKVLIGCRRYKDYVRIYVIDDGPGIPMEKFRDIFEEFSQLDNPGRKPSGGQGLGLSIADRIARQLGHRLGVSSLPDTGSSFFLEVPLSHTVSDTTNITTSPKSTNRKANLIVLIKPQSNDLEETAVQLRQWGYRVLAFQSIEEAQNLFIRPQLIISNHLFHNRTNGFEVINIMRGSWKIEAPAIVLVSELDPNVLVEADKYNCRIIPNPPDPEEFKDTIHELITKQ